MTLYVKPLSTGEVIEHLITIAPKVFPREQVDLTVSTPLGHVGFAVHRVGSQALAAEEIIKAFLAAWGTRRTLMCTSAKIGTTGNNNAYVHYQHQGTSLHATLTLHLPDEVRVKQAVEALDDTFRPSPYPDLAGTAVAEGERNAMQLRERTVTDLTSALERLGALQAELLLKDTEERRRIGAEQDKEHRARIAELERAHEARQKELEDLIAARNVALATREREHEERVARFETREPKVVRRQLSDKLQTELRNRGIKFELSKDTGKKRTIVHLFTWILMALAGIAAWTMLTKVANGSGAADLLSFIPLGASTATLVTTFIYYLKWNDRWFREHADAELSAKRFEADVLRAAWLAELVFEWQAEKELDPPPELISAFTRNMFRDAGPARESEHPIESLTGMIKRITSVTVGKGVISVQGLAEKAERSSARLGSPRATRPTAPEAEPHLDN